MESIFIVMLLAMTITLINFQFYQSAVYGQEKATTAQVAKLIVKVHVNNDDGGTKKANDFTILILSNNRSESRIYGSESGMSVILNAGLYGISELADSSYESHLLKECNGSIAAGETRTCIITKDDIARYRNSLPTQEGGMLDDQTKQLIDKSDQLINEFNNTERELPDEIVDTKREVKQQSDNGSELLVGKKKP